MKEPEARGMKPCERAHARADAKSRSTRQTLKPETKPVTLTSPSGASRGPSRSTPAEAGVCAPAASVEELGLYRLTDGELTALVNVGPENPREFQEVVSTPDKARVRSRRRQVERCRRISDRTRATRSRLPRFVSMRESPDLWRIRLCRGQAHGRERRHGDWGSRRSRSASSDCWPCWAACLMGWLSEGRRKSR